MPPIDDKRPLPWALGSRLKALQKKGCQQAVAREVEGLGLQPLQGRRHFTLSRFTLPFYFLFLLHLVIWVPLDSEKSLPSFNSWNLL